MLLFWKRMKDSWNSIANEVPSHPLCLLDSLLFQFCRMVPNFSLVIVGDVRIDSAPMLMSPQCVCCLLGTSGSLHVFLNK